ncbi:nuclear protein DGCR14 [Coniochaeta sp. 2T2.1]|nr:nuclear protein DGCR14 [Coniochaeta sp. 2T2.1]
MASEPSSSSALVRKRTDTELMPPPPPAKRIKRPRKVLDEDTYTDALSQIIARDFFPGLLESETQQEYLDALESKDDAWISNAGRRLQQVMTPGRRRGRIPTAAPSLAGGQTPTTGFLGDTPVSVVSTSTVAEEKTAVDTNMNLGAFQAKYTSEDNESFYKLLDKQNQKRAEKYAWLWRGNKLPSKQQLKQKEIEDRISKTRSLEDDGYKDRRLVIRDKDDRPAAPEHWKSKPNNQLMFAPDGVDGLIETPAQRAQAESRAAPKTIVYENTRMPGPSIIQEPESSVPPSPSLSAVRDAIAGRSRPGYQDSTIGSSGGETPRVNGYAFVDDEEPELAPSRAPPLITMSAGDATPNPFQLQDQGRREALHHKMVDKISRSKRTSAYQGLTGKVERTPVPRFPSSPRVTTTPGGMMTPAAQRLWGKIGSAGSRRADDMSPFSKVKVTPRGRGSGLKNLAK